jgi:hypothetical protein
MAKKVNGFIFWTPRILSILFILFLALFSLDVISSEYSIGEILLGLLMHNIPSLVLLIVLLISWKYEIVGGIVFLLAGLLYVANTMNSEIPWHTALIWSMTIAGPAFLIGGLFLANWSEKRSS